MTNTNDARHRTGGHEVSDITERLRSASLVGTRRHTMECEAADAIDSLRAEVAVLQMACSRWERALEHGADRIRNAEAERDSLRAQVEALRSLRECDGDLLLRLVVDLRFALGDDGLRMQDELVQYAKELRADAERYRWLRSIGGKTWHHIERDCLAVDDLYDAAVDAARSQEDKG